VVDDDGRPAAARGSKATTFIPRQLNGWYLRIIRCAGTSRQGHPRVCTLVCVVLGPQTGGTGSAGQTLPADRQADPPWRTHLSASPGERHQGLDRHMEWARARSPGPRPPTRYWTHSPATSLKSERAIA